MGIFHCKKCQDQEMFKILSFIPEIWKYKTNVVLDLATPNSFSLFILQLVKANAATLTAWLKARGIQCKAKDKKTDLVEKVKAALNIVSTEQ
jgi:hypothetical protein